MSAYPEHNKIKIHNNENKVLQAFVEFLKDSKYFLSKQTMGYDKRVSFQNIIYEFFEVDPVKLEKERLEILKTHNENPGD